MQTIKKQGALWLWSLLLTGALLTGCKPPGARALLKGKRLLDNGKYQEAAEQLRAATTLLPTNALAFNYLGLALHQAGQPAEAERSYLRALALNHGLVEVRYNLGCLLLAQNKPDQAKAELTAFTLRRVNSPDGWLKLGTAQLRTREPTAAERSFAEVLRLRPKDAEATTGIGLCRLERSRPQEAVQYFNKALQEQPDYAPAVLNLAIVSHEQLKDKKAALDQYRKYLALNPRAEHADQVQALVKQLQQELAPPPAVAPAPVVTSHSPQPNAPVASATNTAPAGTQPLAVAPSRTNAPSTNAPVIAKSEQKPVAAPPPQNSNPQPQPTAKPSVPPSTTPLQSSSSTPLVQRPSAPTAHTNVPATTRPQPTSPAAPLEVVTLSNEPVFKAAEDVPSKPAPAVAAASPSNQPANASPESSSTAETKPAKKGFIRKLNPARLFSKDDQTAAADTSVRTEAPAPKAAEPEPALASSMNFQRYPYKSPAKPETGNHTDAERAFVQGLQAHNAHRLSDAITGYGRAVQLDPAYYEAYYNLAMVYAESGNLQQALVNYEWALAIRPQALDARYSFALALKRANFPVDAANELQKLLSNYPSESRAHLVLANLYDQQFKDPAKAKVHYLKVLETDPHNPEAGNIRFWLASHGSK